MISLVKSILDGRMLFLLCAEHVQQPGGASALQNLMEVK
jgi:hypothetical protein